MRILSSLRDSKAWAGLHRHQSDTAGFADEFQWKRVSLAKAELTQELDKELDKELGKELGKEFSTQTLTRFLKKTVAASSAFDEA